MTKTKVTKKALASSLLALMLCVSMLLGTTYAWFTDSVVSGGNKIVSGRLDIDLYQYDGTTYQEITDSHEPIFGSAASAIAQNNNADTLWEPGKTQVAYLKLVNNGNLWLKYTVALVVKNVAKDLYEVMQYEIVPDAHNGDVTAWDPTPAITVGDEITLADGASATLTTQAINVPMAPGAEHYFALAIHMKEEAGNAYQEGEVDFDLNVLATQYSKEEDSFNDQYDANADGTPDNANFLNFTTLYAPVTAGNPTKIGDVNVNGAEANLSADAVADATSLSLIVKETEDSDSVITIQNADGAKYIDVSLVDQDANVVESFENNGYADVKLDIGTNLVINEVNHKTTPLDTDTIKSEYYSYDAATGILTIHVTSFSPFSIGYDEAVAKTNEGKYYTSFYGAVKNAPDNGTVTLLKDTTLDGSTTNDYGYVKINKDLTVDMNGNTIFFGEDDGWVSYISIAKGYTVTITGNGTFSDGAVATKSADYMIQNSGTLFIENGTFASYKKTVINALGADSTTTIYDGIFINLRNSSNLFNGNEACVVKATQSGTFNVYGGKFYIQGSGLGHAQSDSNDSKYFGAFYAERGTLNIGSGEYDTEPVVYSNTALIVVANAVSSGVGTVNINKVTFNIEKNNGNYYDIYRANNRGTVTINNFTDKTFVSNVTVNQK